MHPQRHSRLAVAIANFCILIVLLSSHGWLASGLASNRFAHVLASPTHTTEVASGLGNYDIRINGGSNFATLLTRYVPQGAQHTIREQAAAMRAGLTDLMSAVPGAEARFSPLTGSAEVVRNQHGALTRPAPGRPGAAIVRDFLHTYKLVYGLNDTQIAELYEIGQSISRRSGLRMVRFEQRIGGRSIFQSDTRFILDRDGRLIRSVGLLIPNAAVTPAVQPIAPSTALQFALASVDVDVVGPTIAPPLTYTALQKDSAEVRSTDLQIKGAVASQLVYFPLAPGVLVLAWSQVTFTTGAADWYTLSDAGTGTLLWRKNIRSTYDILPPQTVQMTAARARSHAIDLSPHARSSLLGPTASTQQARFSVYVQADGMTPADSPAPRSPVTMSAGDGTQFPAIARTTVNMLSALHPIASPAGWIADGGTTTTGNNVDAYLDTDDDGAPDVGLLDSNGRPIGNPNATGHNRDFLGAAPRDYTYTPAPDGNNPDAGDSPQEMPFRRGALTQLFYVVNWYHDQLYDLGFDEAAGNFQFNTFGRGGLGDDGVLAEAQNGFAFNVATFATPPDGQPGNMQVYIHNLHNAFSIDRDAALDAEVIIHELTHGLSNRLIGNSAGLVWRPANGLAEGWSDFYALALLNGTNADDPDGSYAWGAYSFYGNGGHNDNYLYGGRRFPYTTNNQINPLTWADIDDSTIDESGGIPLNPNDLRYSPALQVHYVGEVWALSLWEVRSRIIADPAGADGDVPTGNHTMLQLTTDALKLTPLNPSVIDARDALIDADCATNNCANERSIWAGFADRGLGYGAVGPFGMVSYAYGSHMGVGESFTIPYLDVAHVAIGDRAGNDNGAIDPGEPIVLTVTLANPWHGAARHVESASATLHTTTPSVTILKGTSTYGAIASQSTAAGTPFVVMVAPSAVCGQSLTFTIDTTSSLGNGHAEFTIRIGAPAGVGAPMVYSRSIPGGRMIPDNTPRGVTDMLQIADDREIADLDFRVDSLLHPFTGDLSIMLKGPTGVGTDVIFRRGMYTADASPGAGVNFVDTVIDDEATSDLNMTLASAAPYTGRWLPAYASLSIVPEPTGQLNSYDGLSTRGTWMALVSDNYWLTNNDSGRLQAWSLIVTPRTFHCAAFTPTASVVGAKTVGGTFVVGSPISYTVTLTNGGAKVQNNNVGNEFIDALPPQIALISASATSDTIAVDVASNTVAWNGALAPLGGMVTITIHAIIKAGAGGATIANQGTIAFDADGDGVNESYVVTDDPATSTSSDPTVFLAQDRDHVRISLPIVTKGGATNASQR
jgi:uncharacterized repeat protein (TIGR01451 family)